MRPYKPTQQTAALLAKVYIDALLDPSSHSVTKRNARDGLLGLIGSGQLSSSHVTRNLGEKRYRYLAQFITEERT